MVLRYSSRKLCLDFSQLRAQDEIVPHERAELGFHIRCHIDFTLLRH